MGRRREFLAAIATGSAALVLTRGAQAQIPAPTPAPGASPPPTAAAMAFARQMRAYDPALTDAEISAIAQQVDGNTKSGKRLNPAGKRLKNADEPATIFRVRPT